MRSPLLVCVEPLYVQERLSTNTTHIQKGTEMKFGLYSFQTANILQQRLVTPNRNNWDIKD
jgi:hypothetical protein